MSQVLPVVGSGDSTAESGLSGDAWVASIPWVVPPDTSCPQNRRWGVGYLAPG